MWVPHPVIEQTSGSHTALYASSLLRKSLGCQESCHFPPGYLG